MGEISVEVCGHNNLILWERMIVLNCLLRFQ